MSKEVHSTYFKVRHRITGLFLSRSPLGIEKWSARGRLFKNKRALHGFLACVHVVPREWEIVPVELVVRDDRAVSAASYVNVRKKELEQKEERKRA